MVGKVLRLSVFGKFQSRIPNRFLSGQEVRDSSILVLSVKILTSLNQKQFC